MDPINSLTQLTTAVLTANHVDQSVRELALKMRDELFAEGNVSITVGGVALSLSQYRNLADICYEKNKPYAIKQARADLGLSLKEAKELIDAIQKQEQSQ